MAKQKYIRLTTENMEWTGKVAEFVNEYGADYGAEPIGLYYIFKDVGSSMGHNRITTADEAEFITKKEYFTAILQGKLFGG